MLLQLEVKPVESTTNAGQSSQGGEFKQAMHAAYWLANPAR